MYLSSKVFRWRAARFMLAKGWRLWAESPLGAKAIMVKFDETPMKQTRNLSRRWNDGNSSLFCALICALCAFGYFMCANLRVARPFAHSCVRF